jgi:peptide/nickel transport system substrate-binding protein
MTATPSHTVTPFTRRRLLQGAVGGAAGLLAWHQGWPQRQQAMAQKSDASGEMRWAVHVTIAPTWFDPAETPNVITPYMFLYAMHDALIRPMPDNKMTPHLATRWSESADGLTYDFELRQGVKFHNGDPFMAEDVKFSFERYKGAGATELHKRVKAVEIVNPHQVRFQLNEPWPDFLAFYGTLATGAGWIVPKKYTEQIGNDKFKEQPVGLGPYRFVSYQPGVELVLEAFPEYWRQPPAVKRLVLKSVPEATTRLAMLKQQEADVAYALYGPLGEDVQRDKRLKLEPVLLHGTDWLTFVDQYEPKSPWTDKRVRQAANHAINRQAINDAETLGHSKLTGNIIPREFDFALPFEPYPYDPKKARQLLKEAGYGSGFDAGEYTCDVVYAGVVEAIVNDFAAVGIRAQVRPMERAAVFAAHRDKKVKNLTRQGSGAYGNAATRIETFMTSQGAQSFLKDADIDAWYAQQAVERDRQKRTALLHKIQQKMYDEALFAPIWELGFLCASGPRVAVSGLGRIAGFAYSAPYDEVRLKA